MVHELKKVDAYHDGQQWNYAGPYLVCEQGCGCIIRVPEKDGRPDWDRKERICNERPIQDAIDSGLPERDFEAYVVVCEENIVAHHWSSIPWFKMTSMDWDKGVEPDG